MKVSGPNSIKIALICIILALSAVAGGLFAPSRVSATNHRVNLDEVMAGAEHPIRVVVDPDAGQPAPYVHVRDRLEALIARAVFYDLVELGVEEEHNGESHFGVWSADVFFPLAKVTELEDC